MLTVTLQVFRRIQRSPLRIQTMATLTVANEPLYDFTKGSTERQQLEEALKNLEGKCEEIPVVIGGEKIFTGNCLYQVCPFDHQRKIAKYHLADKELINKAIENALSVREEWEARPLTERTNIFLKAADLISTKYRPMILAATMIGQGKNVWQAEIDAAAELVDFYRFNAKNALDIAQYKPIDTKESVNTMEYRGLEGFFAAISPFNFTAIAGNLAGTPAMMGNVVLWKPSDTAMLSGWTIYNILREAGLPDGVVQFLPADGPTFGNTITASPELSGINFTGSVKTFRHLWKQVGQNLDIYKSFPRLMGECGGKNGDDFSVFMSAVIDDKSFARIKGYIDHAKSSPNLTILAGGNCDDR
ncbi:delta-1-pyrroline-5-carboxylate dehydrogenase, mitochondrial-like [Saccoglossus kowalevskii]|uniref:Delta-1-pyrroline-5-carboxylate dehydrogenase, mitochondrial-like n=1 Tax=Saccoglossus kowalevskii TaxID=10224 RepID=A0ABM0MKC1_SACKO|nr:PREDICTED: delta-1-pyrroline-5-carboxylate dehydrogenase, mitochondrial-like [Saccoglossus kowalevskii]